MSDTDTGMVQLEVGNQIHSVQYRVTDGVVTVSYGGRSKSAAAGDLPPQDVARVLLMEIVRDV